MARACWSLLTAVLVTAGAVLYADEPKAGASPDSKALVPAATVATPIPAGALSDVSASSGLLSEQVSGLSVVRPGGEEIAAPAGASPNRVLPANVDNISAFSREAAYSPNWLLDGVRRLEAMDKGAGESGKDPRARESRDAKTDRDSEAIGAAATATTTSDPLVQYLQKWLTTPEAVAAATATISSFGNNGRDDGNAGAGFSAAAQTTAQTQAPAINSALLITQLTEPLLESPGPTIVLQPPPMPAGADAAVNSLLTQSQETARAPVIGAPENKELKIKPITPQPDPNQPLVNDKKYFPQLQRF